MRHVVAHIRWSIFIVVVVIVCHINPKWFFVEGWPTADSVPEAINIPSSSSLDDCPTSDLSTEGDGEMNGSCRNSLSDPPKMSMEIQGTNKGDDYNDNDDAGDEEDDEEDKVSLELNTWSKPQLIYLSDEEILDPILKKTDEYMTKFLEEESNMGRYKCRNYDRRCTIWASEQDCEEEETREKMVELCSPSCQTCKEYLERFFYNTDNNTANNDGEDDKKEEFRAIEWVEPTEFEIVILSNWGISQYMVKTEEENNNEEFQSALDETDKFMKKVMIDDPNTDERILSSCENTHPRCTSWAIQGECEMNPGFMHLHCGPACQTCETFDYSKRCPTPENTDILKEPGDLNKIFERIVNDPYWTDTYGPLQILSSPELTDGPWIITLENFLTAEECMTFIQEAEREGYERSEDEADEESWDGTIGSVQSDGRTSSNAWCMQDCVAHPILKPVHDRLENFTGVPYINSEYLQLLKYEVGQFYAEHHDYSDLTRDKATGPRILTAFMYLNDVEGDGGTRFGELDITVQPKQGKVLLWPSVLDDHPLDADYRTMHEALPVTAGQKFASNAWLHLRDFKGPYANDCV